MKSFLLVSLALVASTVLGFVPVFTPKAYKHSRRSSTSLQMLNVGDKLPLDTSFQILKDGKPTDVAALELFSGKKVVVLGLPGGYIELADKFKSKGVDSILCLSVNDCFVMSSWGKQLGAEGKVTMLADGGAQFTKATGLDFQTGNFGGLRMQRMSMLVDDGVVKKLHLEGGGGLTSSAAEVLLEEI